jgi:hypothetical protein
MHIIKSKDLIWAIKARPVARTLASCTHLIISSTVFTIPRYWDLIASTDSALQAHLVIDKELRAFTLCPRESMTFSKTACLLYAYCVLY